MAKPKYKIGDTFHSLTIVGIEHLPFIKEKEKRKTKAKIICKCGCGNISSYFPSNVFSGKSTKCRFCQNVKEKPKKIGCIEILEKFRPSNSRSIIYKCKCKCGNIFERNWERLYNRKWIRCPKCPSKPPPLPRKEFAKINAYNKHLKSRDKILKLRNGYLKPIKFSHWESKRGRRFPYYICKCKCGKEITLKGYHIFAIKSCGCLQKERAPKGEKNWKAALKNEEAKIIRDLYNSNTGFRLIDLAHMYNVSESTISSIIRNETYREI